MHSTYYDKALISSAVRSGHHREAIGGLWDEIGQMQIKFLKENGLMPSHRLLDIGCGSLRLGVLAVDYLAPGNYFGTDLNEELMQAGYEREIAPLGLSEKLPASHLVKDDMFDFHTIPDGIDFAIAQSVFTHLPLNHLRRCIGNLRRFTTLRTFFFTVFTAPPMDDRFFSALEQKDGVITSDISDPYHVLPQDIEYLAGLFGLSAIVSDWGHPRNQRMVTIQYPRATE